jgi:hypothetical protein
MSGSGTGIKIIGVGSGTGTPVAPATPAPGSGEEIFVAALRDMLDGPLGEDATWTPLLGDPETMRVFYNKESMRELGMEGYRIWVEALATDVSGIQAGDSITVCGTTYKIKAPPEQGDDYMSIIELSID